MSLTEKILANRLGRVPEPGEHVVVPVDLVYMHDGTFPLAFRAMRETGLLSRRSSLDRLVLFIDHASPAPSVAAALVHQSMRRFAREHGVRLYDVGTGISHQVVVEEGLAKPGMIVVGADSHTITLGALAVFGFGVGSTDAAIAAATGKLWIRVPQVIAAYLEGKPKAPIMGKDIALYIIGAVGSDGMIYASIEFLGKGLRMVSMDSRLSIANMMVEAGAKTALFPIDEIAYMWVKISHGIEPQRIQPDSNADYSDELVVELDRLEPLVATPPNVDNVKTVDEIEGVEVDQVFIGSCTNGRYEDFAAVARILRKHRVHSNVRCIAIPASRRVYRRLLRDGIIEVLVEAGCTITYGTCGPCLGAHFGLLAEEEVVVSTTNRNFTGRMGHPKARIYLASPVTAAAAAVEGKITDPVKYLGRDHNLMLIESPV